MNARQTALLTLLLLAAVVTGWFLQEQDSGERRSTVSATGPDMFVDDVTIHIMDETGQPAYQVTAERMSHYPRDERYELTSPFISVHRHDGDSWHIKSERGQVNASGDRLWLLGQVDIRRLPGATTGALRILTRDLLVKPEEEQAETEHKATISAARYRVESTGLTADFRNNRLELRSRVRGKIDVAG